MNSQLQIFNDCATTCEGYAECGGYRSTSPCGCVWPLESGLRYLCKKCNLVCRERDAPFFNGSESIAFEREMKNGLSLDRLNISQLMFDFPINIPTYTHKYFLDDSFSEWVAVDIQILFNCSKRGPAKFKRQFYNSDSVRKFLHVTAECKLIAVFNGFDWMLESIWSMPRLQMLAHLKTLGFTICTGPTFSISKFTPYNQLVPYSHHLIMNMRHNRMLAEIDHTGLCGVPNLYWLQNDIMDQNKWVEWLRANSNVNLISKDFTSTRDWNTIEIQISELIYVLSQTERFFHIFIIGTGARNAGKIVKAITECGHTVTLITSAPIMKAIHGSEYYMNEEGKLLDGKSDIPFQLLIKHNISMFEKLLKNNAA